MTIEIVDFPMKNGGSFHSYVKLPEGNFSFFLSTSSLGGPHAHAGGADADLPGVAGRLRRLRRTAETAETERERMAMFYGLQQQRIAKMM